MSGRRNRSGRATAVALAAALLLAACTGGDDDAVPTPTEPAVGASPEVVTRSGAGAPTAQGASVGLRIREGAQQAQPDAAVAVAAGTPLDPTDVDALLARLPEWDVPPDERVAFARPPVTLPPPLIGATVDTPFPPDGEPPAPAGDDDGRLDVLRVQPEGDVDIAPFVTVTFDEPMVPLATLDALDAGEVPVVITPTVEGRWRWIGTRTLRFEVEPGVTDRLPAATEYRVEIPAGTTSVAGHRLAETASFEFATPAPRLTSFVGESDRLPLEPVFVAVFDQRVDPAAVLPTVTVSADSEPVALRLATADEIAADVDASRAVNDALEGRAVAFRPEAPLPVDSPITVTVGPGTPSAEGPRTGIEPKTYVGRTYGSLTIRRSECGYGDGCRPLSPFTIELSNEIDLDAFAADRITVTPAVPGLAVDVYGPVIQLLGATEGDTEYSVTLDADLRDTFGQTLGTDTTVTFDVGPAEPTIVGLSQERITVDPSAENPSVSIRTVNHDSVRVIAWAVSPTDVQAFRDYLERTWSDVEPSAPDWPVVLDEEIEIDAEPDRFVETAIDLSDAFAAAGSQLVLRVEPTESYATDDRLYWQNRPTVAWVQSTTLAVDAVHDGSELHIWTTDLLTGEPVGNVAVELLGDGRVARTDGEGLATVPLSDTPVTGLFANGGDRTSFLVLDWYEGVRASSSVDESRWYVFDDRGVYRPGETARITGWVRELAWSDDATLRLHDDVGVGWRAYDPQGVELGTGTAEVNALGGFNLTVDIPEGANLGTATVELTLAGASGQASTSHALQIQEYRRPEFEVTARPESTGPYFVGTPATVAVDATYFAGGPLADAEVSWLVSTSRTTYRPPGWDDFQFGIWQPWWWFGEGGERAEIGIDGGWCVDCPPGGAVEYEELAGRTDAAGSHYLEFELGAAEIDLPSTVTAEATVLDVDRQAWASRTDLIVHPAEAYVGLRSDRTFVEAGAPLRYDAVVTDVDGAPVAGLAVEVTAGRVQWSTRGGETDEEIVDPVTCTFSSSADPTDGSMACELPTEVAGEYRITAVVTDAAGRRNRTQSTMWVAGEGAAPSRQVEQEQLTLVPDRETYAVGDTAQVLVQAPFDAVSGLATISHHDIVRTEAFEIEDGGTVFEIPIDDASVPEITVQFDVVGTAPRTADDGSPLPDAPARPAFATGRLTLSVPPVTRALTVDAAPADEQLEPGDDTSVTVTVDGPDGAPVEGAEVALVVVDEAVLALTGYRLADPLDVFYGPLWSNVTAQYTRSTVLLTRDDLLGDLGQGVIETEGRSGASADDAGGDGAATPSAPTTTVPAGGAAGPADAATGEPIDVREQFEPLAAFATGLRTGGDGTVTVEVPLPDTATRYRVMAVAVDGADRFGKGESAITAQLPLTLRVGAPRFANYGDRFELPVVVQNQTDEPAEVEVAVQTANLTVDGSDDGTTGRLVTVPANDRVEVRFPMATDEAGTARVRVVGVGGGGSDAVSARFPVYTPATQEAFATYGVLDDGAVVAQPLEPPTGVIDGYGGLELGTSTTALQALTDAVISLYEYRYTTADGYASRILAIAALRDVLDAFDAEGLPAPDELDRRVDADIAGLVALQNDDGGWSWWARGLPSVPWPTLHAAHALVAADAAGYDVPADALGGALAHLDDIESHIPADYSPDLRVTVRASAVHIRTLAGDRDVDEATSIFRDAGIALQLDALAWLWPAIDDPTISDEIARRITNAATETAGAATFATAYAEDAYVIAVSDRRTDGVILDALIAEAPDSDLIPKVVAGLLGQQVRGHWDSAQDDAFVLLALQRYFRTFEATTPDLVARAWLGTDYVSEQAFRGRTSDRATTLVPMGVLTGLPARTDLVLQNDGTGRLYYRLGLRYAPSDLTLDPRDEGFVVERRYEAIDDPADVRREADGTWVIRPGAAVRVTVTMVADARRTHVALVDPLPAGLEPVNPAFTVSQTFAPDDTPTATLDDGSVEAADGWCWCWQWFEHQNLRDDRAEAFTSFLGGGTYEYTYIARATTPGTFVVPPARAEELYAPEVFGRSASDTVVVG